MDSKTNYELTILNADSDSSKQIEHVNYFISHGFNGMIVNPVSSFPSILASMIDDSDIPCVYANTQFSDYQYPNNTCFVGSDISKAGSVQGQIVYNLSNHGDLNGDGKVSYIMIMGDPENSDAQNRTEYSIKYLTDNGVEVDCLYQETGMWDQAKGQELTASALATYGDAIEVVFCNNDGMALGAYQAITAAGRTVGEDIYLVGIDALAECVEMVNAGTMTGTVLNSPNNQAIECCKKTLEMLSGEEVTPKVNYVPLVMITKSK